MEPGTGYLVMASHLPLKRITATGRTVSRQAMAADQQTERPVLLAPPVACNRAAGRTYRRIFRMASLQAGCVRYQLWFRSW